MVRLTSKGTQTIEKENNEYVATLNLVGDNGDIKFSLTIKGDQQAVDVIKKGYRIENYGNVVEMILKPVQAGLSDFEGGKENENKSE